jgi:GT2 family glycosyltransferase
MPRIVFAHDPATVQYDGGRAHFSGLLAFENAGRAVADCSDRPRELQSLVTACFLLDRGRWGAADPFDELFFYMLEDHDLGLRARIAGHRILSVPAARCLHRSGTPGLSLRRIGRYTDVRVENLVRNRWIILLKHFQLRSLLLLSPVLLAFEGLQLAGAVRKGWLGRWLSAARWLLGHLCPVLRGRRAVQRSRVVPDREILSGGPFPFNDRLLRGGLEASAGRLFDRLADRWWRLARGRL